MSFGVTASLRGLEKLTKQLEQYKERTKTEVSKAMKITATLVHKTAVESILNGGKSGRWYGEHQASAPGEAPANDYGFLASSLKIREDNPLRVLVYSDTAVADYAKGLEFGTAGVEPRPFLNPALDAHRKDYDEMIKKAFKNARPN